MKRRLRRFLLVGALVTLVDVSLFVVLGDLLGERWLVADALAVGLAGIVSFAVHRLVTFREDAYALIDHQPLSFLLAAFPAAATDVAIVAIGLQLGPPFGSTLALKLIAIAVAAMVRLLTYRGALFAAVRSRQQQPAPVELVGGPRLSVVLPSYKAADIMDASIARLRAALDDFADDLEVVVVDDGSGDGTADAARAAGADLVVALPENLGKGGAVRAGMLAANGRSVVFTDIDLAYPPEQIARLVDRLEQGWQVAVGSRRHPDTETLRGAGRLRELGSLGFNLLTYLVLLGNYRDTQCGLKGFRRDVVEPIFGRTIVNGFAFDVEVLHLAERLELSLVEEPVVLDHVEATTVSVVPQAFKMLRDVLRVRRWSATGGYGIEAAP